MNDIITRPLARADRNDLSGRGDLSRRSLARRTIGGLWGLLTLLAGADFVQANPKVYEKALQSTGWVIVPRSDDAPLGTCSVVDRERKLAITSLHLIKNAAEALVFFPRRTDGELVVNAASYLHDVQAINARIVATDRARDLALMQLDSLPDEVTALPFAEQSSRPGQDVHSIGNSGLKSNSDGMLWRYTRGNVRQLYQKEIRAATGTSFVRMIETQSPVNLGDSGGPLLNDDGHLIGVIMAYDPHERLVSHNIDVREVKAFLNQAIAKLNAGALAPRANEATECAKPASLIGAWKMIGQVQDGDKASGTAKFTSDGIYALYDPNEDEPQLGRFAYANGILWLITADSKAFFQLDWLNPDSFSFTVDGIKVSFER